MLASTIQYIHRWIKSLNLLEVFILDELHNDILLWLDLEHFQHQAEEWGGLDVATKDASHILQLHCFVHKKLS